MSSEEDKPPAPPVRLTSNRGGIDRSAGGGVGVGGGGDVPPDMRPLPKGEYDFISWTRHVDIAGPLNNVLLSLSPQRTRWLGPEEENAEEQDQGIEALAHGLQAEHLLSHELRAHGPCGLRCCHRRVYREFYVLLIYGHLQSCLPRHYVYGLLSKNSKSEIFGFHCLCPPFDKLLYKKLICKKHSHQHTTLSFVCRLYILCNFWVMRVLAQLDLIYGGSISFLYFLFVIFHRTIMNGVKTMNILKTTF